MPAKTPPEAKAFRSSFPFIPTIPGGKLLPPLVPNVSLSSVEVRIVQSHQMLLNRFTKNFSIPKTEVLNYWTLFSAILGISFPLHRPYPYNLNRWGFLHFRYRTKCYGHRYWQDRMPHQIMTASICVRLHQPKYDSWSRFPLQSPDVKKENLFHWLIILMSPLTAKGIGNYWPIDLLYLGSYGWWKKSCTTKDDDYPIIYRVLYIPGGAGFCPSTVSQHFKDILNGFLRRVAFTNPSNNLHCHS